MPRLRERGFLLHSSSAVIVLVWLVPSLGLLITSFRSREAISASGWWAFTPGQLTFANYAHVLDAQGMGQAFWNSILITVPSTALTVALGALAAYGFAWGRFPGRDALFLVVIALLVVPLQILLVPVLRLFNALGITGSFLAIWLAHAGFGLPLGIFLMRNFFATLPNELVEAAKVDGAGEWNIFTRVMLPLAVPGIASFAIFQFMWVWNDLLVALVFMNNPEAQPVTVRIQALLGTYASEWDIMSSAAFISMAVPLVVFLALQRYFVTGITAGAVKG